MKQLKKATFVFLSLLTAALMTACGGGSSAPAGSASANLTTGMITGFGSVIVNGVKFSRKTGLADDKVTLGFDDITNATEDNLRIGMIVRVKGAVDTSAGTGEYESIEFKPEIRGPLDSAATAVDVITNRIKVMGREIQVEANTQFDSIRDIAEISGELLAGRHPELEISGNLDDAGVLHATRIARKAADFTTGKVEIKGKIITAAGGSFTIGGVTVNFASTALGTNTVAADIAAGTVVEVKGTLNAGVITATRIEKKNAVEAEVNDNVRIKGTAASVVANNAFTLNGPNGAIVINTASTTGFVKGGATGTSAIVAAGATLEVEGSLQANGSILATKISIEVEKTVKVEGDAATGAFNATAGTLTLNGVTATIAATTRLLDKTGTALTLSSIAAGDHLQFAGVLDATGKVSASQVQRTAAPTKPLSFIQGPVTAKTSTSLTILGITVNTTAGQAKDFIDNRTGAPKPFDNSVSPSATTSQTNFFAALTTDGLSVVKAKGTVSAGAMTATEVELEQPL